MKTMKARDILRGRGAWHRPSRGYNIEVKHPVTGRWHATSGGMQEDDTITLAVFTGYVEKVYDEHGAHDSPHFTLSREGGAIVVHANDELEVRNLRNEG